MDESWMDAYNQSNGTNFSLSEMLSMLLDKSFVINGELVCPCKNCVCGKNVTKEVAIDHLKSVGFSEELTNLLDRWNSLSAERKNIPLEELIDREREVCLGGKKYKKRLADFMVKLSNLKQQNEEMTDESVTAVLKLCNDFLPEGEEVAKSYDELLEVLKDKDGIETPTEKKEESSKKKSKKGRSKGRALK